MSPTPLLDGALPVARTFIHFSDGLATVRARSAPPEAFVDWVVAEAIARERISERRREKKAKQQRAEQQGTAIEEIALLRPLTTGLENRWRMVAVAAALSRSCEERMMGGSAAPREVRPGRREPQQTSSKA